MAYLFYFHKMIPPIDVINKNSEKKPNKQQTKFTFPLIVISFFHIMIRLIYVTIYSSTFPILEGLRINPMGKMVSTFFLKKLHIC